MSASKCFKLSEQAIGRMDFSSCIRICNEGLRDSPNHIPLLINLSRGYIEIKEPLTAAAICQLVIEQNPDTVHAWTNLARAYLDIGFLNPEYYEKSERAVKTALEKDPDDTAAYLNASFLMLALGRHEEGVEYCKKGLKIDSSNTSLIFNMSLSLLANYMWEEGWYCYERNKTGRYPAGEPTLPNPLPQWDGESDMVICFGEQGLGDEIMFSSMIPDLMKDVDVVLDVDERLEGLLARSFDCEVHGTRYDNDAEWKKHTKANYRIPIGSLGATYRTDNKDFPGKPYLIADPERRLQWRALLDSLGDKPKIGIAWTGGVTHTFQKARSFEIRDLYPLLEFDAEWISLQYKNTECPDFIHSWPRATQTNDYDDTAALIAELDLVISVTTTAVHCAGGLGKETWCLVPKSPQWRYGTSGDRMPWYSSVELFRQSESGEWPIQQLVTKLSAMGIERCRNLSTRVPFTVKPRENTHQLLPRLLKSPGLQKFLITGLEKVA